MTPYISDIAFTPAAQLLLNVLGFVFHEKGLSD